MRTSPSSRLALAVASMGVLGLASAARATLIAYDGFTGDSLGTTLSNSANTSPAGGTAFGWASGWAPYSTDPEGTVVNSNLQYNSNSNGYGAQFEQVASTSAYDFRPLTSTQSTAAGSSYYVSYLLSGIGTAGNQVNFISLYSGTAAPTTGSAGGLNAGQMITFGNINTSGLGVQYVTSASGNTNAYAGVTVASTSTTTLLVLEITYGGSGNDSFNFWINPTQQSPTPILTGPLTLYGSNGGAGAPADPAFGMLRIGSNSVSSDPGLFDEIKVGTTFLDVAPEPASISLIGAIGTMALLRRRVRRPDPSPNA